MVQNWQNLSNKELKKYMFIEEKKITIFEIHFFHQSYIPAIVNRDIYIDQIYNRFFLYIVIIVHNTIVGQYLTIID